VTPRYKLRTLLILLAILPPLLWFGWTKYEAWKAERERQKALAAEQYKLKSGWTVVYPVYYEDLRAFYDQAPRDAKAPAKAGTSSGLENGKGR